MAAPLLFVLLVCLSLTRAEAPSSGSWSDSVFCAWRAHWLAPPRVLLGRGLLRRCLDRRGIGLATGQLDLQVPPNREVAPLPLEYWQGTWGVITEGARALGHPLTPHLLVGRRSRQLRRSLSQVQAAAVE